MFPAIVVLFKPASDDYKNIKSYLGRVDRLYLVDNSPSPSALCESLQQEEKVTLLSLGKNLGIAEAYNLGLRQAKQDGYRWLMTMDQDSFFDRDQLESLIREFARTKKGRLGIYAPLHNSKFLSQEGDKQVFVVMSSASIVNVEAVVSLGGFDRKLFIDEVDHEICIRLHKNGYSIVQNQRVFVNHSLGRKLVNGKKKYSAARLYYMVRNHLYMRRKYRHSYSDYLRKRGEYMRKFLFEQLLFQDRKFHRIKMLCAAIADFYSNKMGKRVEI